MYHAHAGSMFALLSTSFTLLRAGAEQGLWSAVTPHVTCEAFLVFLSLSVGNVTVLTETAMSTLSVPRIIDVTEVFQRNLTLDTAKNCFLVYFIAKRALKLWRHVYARGLFRSLRELYVSIAQVFPISLLLTRSPSTEIFTFVLESLSACY
jgi:hypothetical protein